MLTEKQRGILLDYARQGGQLLIAGRLAEGTGLAEALRETGNATFVSLEGDSRAYTERVMRAFEELYAPIAPVECPLSDVGVQRYDSEGRTWVHLLNYRYDEAQDRILPAAVYLRACLFPFSRICGIIRSEKEKYGARDRGRAAGKEHMRMTCFFEEGTGPRDSAFFGFDWAFVLTDSRERPGEGAAWRSVQLPHDWSTDYPVEEGHPSCGSGGYARCGIGWYRKRFRAAPRAEQLYSLYFEGVYMNCTLWVNGREAGDHIYGYTSFEKDITPFLREGENEVLVRVDNSHQPGSRWYTGSGITRPVYLRRHGKVYVRTWGTGITVTELSGERALAEIRTEVRGGGAAGDLRVETAVLDPSGREVARDIAGLPGKNEITAVQTLTVPNPQRWDLDTPRLYRARTRVWDGEALLDETETAFGIRDIVFDQHSGFTLNGRKVILRGVCLHHDGGCLGAAVPPEVWRRRLEKLKEMGCNALRMSHNPPDPALLDLADELGFCVMDEAFDEWHTMKGKEFGSNTHESRGYSEWFDTCAREDLTAMVERDRHHPSIIMWSIGNEVREQVVPDGWKYARMLAGLCHSLDPGRPITQACDMVKAEPVPAHTAFLEQLDIVGVNYTDRWRERTETFYEEEKLEHPDWLLMGSEDISVSGARGDYRLKTPDSVWGRTPYYARSLKAEKLWKFIRTRPYVLGSFMWTGIDYLGECFWPDKSASAGVLDTCGYPKDGFYFYQSVWRNDVPVLHVFPHLNLPLAEGTIYPVVAYTNCPTVELVADGVSYGVKCYEFPNQGMTKEWPHFDRPLAPVTTNDLHLSWDIPAGRKEIVAIGRDLAGNEIARQVLRVAGPAAHLALRADREALPADGRSVVQLEMMLRDEAGNTVPDQELPVQLTVEGGTLLGMDNGLSSDRTMYRTGTRSTYRGLAFAVVRAPREKGMLRLRAEAEGLSPVALEIPVG